MRALCWSRRGPKATHRARNTALTVLSLPTYGVSLRGARVEGFHCPHCGGPVRDATSAEHSVGAFAEAAEERAVFEAKLDRGPRAATTGRRRRARVGTPPRLATAGRLARPSAGSRMRPVRKGRSDEGGGATGRGRLPLGAPVLDVEPVEAVCSLHPGAEPGPPSRSRLRAGAGTSFPWTWMSTSGRSGGGSAVKR